MLKKKHETQTTLEMVSIDQLVPKDHLLRKIDRGIDFSFIRPLVEPLYCADNGRPALDPERQFKMLFIGYLFGIRSERQLVREVEVNVAYRWFLGLGKVREQSLLSAACRNMKKIAQVVFLWLFVPNTEPEPGFTAPGIESCLFFLPMQPNPLAA